MTIFGLILIALATFGAGMLLGFIPTGMSLPLTERQAFILGYYGCGAAWVVGAGMIIIGAMHDWNR